MFGFVLVVTILIMEPVSLELNKIRTGHNSETDLATAPMANDKCHN